MRPSLVSVALVASGISSLACWSGGQRPPSDTGAGGAVVPSDPNAGDVGAVTSCAGTQATFPALAALSTTAGLPDPFLAMDGTRIERSDQWPCRRAEIGAQAQVYELGSEPSAPTSVTGTFDAGQLAVTVTDGGKTITFTATVTWPTAGTAPYPAMIGIGGISIGSAQLAALGVATIVFPNNAVAAQDNASSRGLGAFYDLYGSKHPAGAMMAWAWGVSRLIDAIETTPAAQIDPGRLGVTGCSRNGKGALIVGAFEDRIVLTIPQESGSGGSASWRISDAQVADGTLVQTLSEITGENVWFRSSFNQFGSAATKLPFDHHLIEGMVAPRALLIVENSSQIWLGDVSTYSDSMAAHAIWEALGIPDKMGVSQVGAHMHCEWNGTQQPEVTAYVQKFLVGGGTASTSILKTDGSYSFDKARWAPWDVPTLQGAGDAAVD